MLTHLGHFGIGADDLQAGGGVRQDFQSMGWGYRHIVIAGGQFKAVGAVFQGGKFGRQSPGGIGLHRAWDTDRASFTQRCEKQGHQLQFLAGNAGEVNGAFGGHNQVRAFSEVGLFRQVGGRADLDFQLFKEGIETDIHAVVGGGGITRPDPVPESLPNLVTVHYRIPDRSAIGILVSKEKNLLAGATLLVPERQFRGKVRTLGWNLTLQQDAHQAILAKTDGAATSFWLHHGNAGTIE